MAPSDHSHDMNTPSFASDYPPDYAANLSGKVALVTGSSRGIGRAMALALAKAGADVIIHASRNSAAVNKTTSDCLQLGVRAVSVTADLSDTKETNTIIEHCADALSLPDILVLNASLQFRHDWNIFNQQEAETTMQVNVFASMTMMSQAIPIMQERRWGRVITVGSVQQSVPNPSTIMYGASKMAQLHLMRSLAPQVAADGITINNLAPGVIATDRTNSVLQNETYAQAIRKHIPADVFGQPEDCCGALLMLCSDAGQYITGCDMPIDGGMSLAMSPHSD